MGGEWGVGAALALETLPARNRGFFSGILQVGYVLGYLLASVLFGAVFDLVGWRGLFAITSVSALFVLYVRSRVEESPAWLAGAAPHRASLSAICSAVRVYFPMLCYLVPLMACFNAFSHGSQDLYPTFLQVQHGFSTRTTASVTIVMNLGALAGGGCFRALSERLGRRRTIALAAVLASPVIPLWAYAQTAVLLALGGFLMQFMVQGAWGIVPAHLNELSPSAVRAILPGFAYQLGNLAMSKIGPFQAGSPQHAAVISPTSCPESSGASARKRCEFVHEWCAPSVLVDSRYHCACTVLLTGLRCSAMCISVMTARRSG